MLEQIPMAFLILLPLVAFLYASVGHGGASGYLGLMALFSFPIVLMKPTALLLNLFVAAVSFFQFKRFGFFKWRLFYLFAISSIPAAFIGGYVDIDGSLYKKILAVVLLLAILKLMGVFGKESKEIKQLKLWQGLIIGGLIGLVSGMIGIGGGIILSPIILLMKWGDMKTTAAVSALFIWVNSAAAMLGLLLQGTRIEPQAIGLVILALLGGLLGAYFGSKYVNNKTLRTMLAAVLLMACVKLILI
jgi:uncharacterized membrane protein YfcA